MKKNLFPLPIQNLPEADIPFEGLTAYLSQSENHQIIFMAFENDVELPEHKHDSQVGFVLSGRIDMIIDGEKKTYEKGDVYYIPKDILHSGFIHAGYTDITFFDQADRYKTKAIAKDDL